MAAGKYDISIEQGTTYLLSFTWGPDVNTVYNLTGYTARMQIRQLITSAQPIIDMTTENGYIVINGAQGKVTIGLTATDTTALNFTSPAVYDAILISPSGGVTRILKGSVALDPEVTR